MLAYWDYKNAQKTLLLLCCRQSHMGLGPQALQQLLLLPLVVNMAVMLRQQLLQQLPPALEAAHLLLQLPAVAARCCQKPLWSEGIFCIASLNLAPK